VCVRSKSSFIDKISVGKRGSRDPIVRLAEGKMKVETFKRLKIFQVREEGEISGGGATIAVRSAAEEKI
jgi:hypothetical protein